MGTSTNRKFASCPKCRRLYYWRSRALSHVEQESENYYGYHGEHHVKRNPSAYRRTPLFPIAELGAILHSHLFGMLQLLGELAGGGVAILGIAFHGAIDDLLQLGRDCGIDFTRRNRVVEQPLVHGGERIGTPKGRRSSQHFIQHDTQSV